MDSDQCRICLTNNNLSQHIFNTASFGQLHIKIMSLTNVLIHPNDGLPTFICTNCYKTLEICLEFIQLCQKSDRALRNGLTTKIKDETEVYIKEEDLSVHEDDSLSSLTQNSQEFMLKTNENINECTSNDITNKLTNLNMLDKVSKKHQCFTCGKIMSSRFRLKTHQATHSTEKAHTCTLCNKKFTISQNLNVHMRIHTGEKPFNCSLCGESFAQSSGLAAHKRKHTGQTPYQCSLCPRSFRTIGHLQYHVRCHTGEKNYECNTCSRAFITRSDLKQHLLTHVGDKPHICSICGMRLSRASNLKRHIKYAHDKRRTFKCVQCPSNFVSKTDLTKHQKTHCIEINK